MIRVIVRDLRGMPGQSVIGGEGNDGFGRCPAYKNQEERAMSVNVVEISGTGIVAFNEKNLSEAKRFVGAALESDFLVLITTNGKPLWDGKSELFVREAFPEEEQKWAASKAQAVRSGELEDDVVGSVSCPSH
jgi:hypothetical protein